MNKLIQSTFAKIAAIFLLMIFAATFLLGAAAIILLADSEVYYDDGTSLRYSLYSKYTREAETEIMASYVVPFIESGSFRHDFYNSDYSYLSERYSSDNSNIFFNASLSDGTVIFSNYTDDTPRFRYSNEWSVQIPATAKLKSSEVFYYNNYFASESLTDSSGSIRYYVLPQVQATHKGDIALTYAPSDTDSSIEYTEDTITFTAGIRGNLAVKDKLYYVISVVNFFIANRYTLIAVCALSLLLAIILFIFLIYSAGHKKGVDEIYLEPQDKIPLDIFAAADGFVICLLMIFISEVFLYGNNSPIFTLSAIAFGLFICVFFALSFILTFATRIKAGKWWRNTLIFKCLHLIYRICRKLFKLIVTLFSNLPLFWKTALIFSAISLFEFIVIVRNDIGTTLMWWFIEKIIVGSILFFIVIDMKHIKKGAEEIAGGNTGYKIDTKNMFGDFKQHAIHLNRVNDGMQKAVNERMKSERLKTELITNVSHDLKTPLTSIINYVDLLKQENIECEKAIGYLDVLDRQSKRLQKLTADLLEASKASTGNIKINAEATDINVFLSQLSGEYEEKLTQSSLELITSTAEESMLIYADGKLLWRVFDNLMNNICKYAQENTRVYVSAYIRDEKVIIEFKNISKYQLNISSDELMERFVRGDQSRNTEGSGLGLSIAKSLVELQNGKLELVIDGDLFKAIISFDLCNQI